METTQVEPLRLENLAHRSRTILSVDRYRRTHRHRHARPFPSPACRGEYMRHPGEVQSCTKQSATMACPAVQASRCWECLLEPYKRSNLELHPALGLHLTSVPGRDLTCAIFSTHPAHTPR